MSERRGDLGEAFLLGEVRNGEFSDYSKQETELLGRKQNDPSIREALDLVKNYQPLIPESRKQQDPSNPVKKFPKKLLEMLKLKLGLKAAKQLRYYTAVGSWLDIKKGTDAVIEIYDGASVMPEIVRLDYTLRDEKIAEYQDLNNKYLEGQKLTEWEFKTIWDRVVFGGAVPDEITDGETKYNKYLNGVADAIVEKLKLIKQHSTEKASEKAGS